MNKLTFIITLFCVVSYTAFAQISGTVTIDQTAQASATNYQSFTGLANALNAQGLNGPLVVNVLANTGPYVEQPVFNQMAGISASNTITINGNNNELTASGTAIQPWTLLLNGADHLFVNNLNVTATGTTYGFACVLCNDAQFNIFTACSFSCVANGSTAYQVPVSIRQSSVSAPGSGTTGPSGSNNVFRLSSMYSGYYGVYLDAATNSTSGSQNTFSNCVMSDWYNAGLFATNHQSLTVKGCLFGRPARTVYSAMAHGMYLLNNPGGLVIDGNCITNFFPSSASYTNTVHGLFVSDMSSGITPALIKNNFVTSLGSKGSTYGFNLYKFYGSCNSNTILINDTNSNSNFAYGIHFTPNTSDSAKFRYNFISMTQGPPVTQYAFYITGPGKLLINNNSYYVTSSPNSYIGYHTATAQTFSAWQGTGVDAQGTNYTNQPALTSNCSMPTNTLTVSIPDREAGPALVNLFPNPVGDHMFIDLYQDGLHHMTLRDLSGREVFSLQTKESRTQHPMNDLPAGIYFLEIRSDRGFEVKKVIKD